MVDAMYEVPSNPVKKFTVDAKYVQAKLEKAHFEKTKISEYRMLINLILTVST